MDKIQLLQERKMKIAEAGKDIRADIAAIVDEESFVELSAFSFSKNEFYGENAEGEGVVTGYATIDGYPYYIVAQNFKVLDGGMSKASCDKIVKCLDVAEKNAVPVVYLLNTHGVQVGEGVTVLEGLANVLMKATQLDVNGGVSQYVIVNGEVYGAAAMLAAIADFTFFVKNKSVLAINSPFVLSAKAGKNLTKEEVGGAKALDKTGVVSLEVEDLADARDKIVALSDMLRVGMVDAELNECAPILNESVAVENLLSIFENYIEINANYEPEIKTVIARIGGISIAAAIFDGGDNGVEMTVAKMDKMNAFASLANAHGLPFVTFTDTKGLCPCACANNSRLLKATAEYLENFNYITAPKISVVYKKAIGLGYSLFASKSVGFDYTCAFANAKIALFDSVQGAQIELGNEKADKAALVAKYADENSDPINAAKDGYIDAIIEPQFVKQYLISSLQMLAR
ncbi:MAG: hypothetical protein E7352_00650 [Clostridiales bacterium]|nr:hypothetical protein [Clostridiales bacterium]